MPPHLCPTRHDLDPGPKLWPPRVPPPQACAPLDTTWMCMALGVTAALLASQGMGVPSACEEGGGRRGGKHAQLHTTCMHMLNSTQHTCMHIHMLTHTRMHVHKHSLSHTDTPHTHTHTRMHTRTHTTHTLARTHTHTHVTNSISASIAPSMMPLGAQTLSPKPISLM